jgi:putative spermidine/putrescine transport system ATP-binding protein
MLLAGFETPTHGEIRFEGVPINNVPPWLRDMGMVFQNYALFPHMTVAENVAFPLQMRKWPKSEIAGRVRRALSMVRLDGFEARRPGQLSGGQQQRVAVARALVFEPKLVLMDEPLGALDKQLRERMQYEIKQLHAELGLTIVYVTHDQSEALTMSDRVAVFHSGEIQQLAHPASLYEEPANSFVAEFIGENNQFSGTLIERSGQFCSVRLSTGGVIRALAVNVGREGEPVLLSLRPERVLLNPPPTVTPNLYEAEVRELIFLGDHLRVHLSIPGSDQLILKIPNSLGRSRLEPGQRVTIGWRPEDCRALDAPSSASHDRVAGQSDLSANP